MSVSAGPEYDWDSTSRFVPGPWTITAVALGFFGLFGGQLVGALLHQAAGLPQAWAIVVAGFGFLAVAFFAFSVLVPRVPNGYHAMGLYEHPLRRSLIGVFYYLPLAVLIFSSSFLTQAIARFWEVQMPKQSTLVLFADSADDATLRFGILFVAIVLAPLGEELLFRGILHGWLRRYMRFWPAAGLGGLLFGLMHAEATAASLLITVPLAVMGVCLCWLRERRGGMWACIAFHSLHNGLTLAALSSIQDF